MEMTPDNWNKVKALFEAALAREPSERATFLAQNCPDENLRQEVEKLLANYEEAGSFLSDPVLPRQVPEARAPEESPRFESVPEQPLATATSAETEDPMVGRVVGVYRLVRRVGEGGMAAVYLAVRADGEFRQQVAIKLIRPGLDSGEVLRRFRNERQTLAGLDHPNIVKLLDGGSTPEALPYLVMDYVEGSPIDQYCDNRKLSVDERLHLFSKVCGGVQYAHQKRVIHRDLKPSNVLVTAEGVPKLLDFGIAKVLVPEPSGQALPVTQTGTRCMTPAYASPEQVHGKSVTSATDIYSLGVVLYELLTGHRPYRLKEHTPAEMERAICEQEPEPPSTVVSRVESETSADGTSVTKTPELVSQTREGQPEKLRRRLRGDLDTIILKALRKEPQRRYLSVEDFSDDIQRHLNHLPVTARASSIGYRTSRLLRRHRWEIVAAALMFFVLLGAVALTRWEMRHAASIREAQPQEALSKGRRSVAILGFHNLTGRPDKAWLSTAVSEMLTTELSAGGELRTVPGETVARAKLDLSLPETDALSRETLRRVRKNLNCDFVVVGSYLDQGQGNNGQIRLDLRLQDALTAETLTVVAQAGTETDLSDLASRAGGALRRKLGAGEVSPAELAGVRASVPSNPDAARLYAEGLARLRIFDAVGALDPLKKAIAAAPDFAMAHSALADAWRTIGHDADAKQEAKAAFDLAGSLQREQSLLIEGSYRQAAREWDKAIEVYRTLFNFFPDNLDYGLNLASAQTAGGKAPDALATVEVLRKLPPPQGADPRIDLAESVAANSIADYKRQQSAASRGAQKADAIGARLVLARARLAEGRAIMELGEPAKAIPLLEQARDIFAATGNRFSQARVLQNLGLANYYQSRFDEAKKTYEEALAIQQELGNRANQAKLWNGIGMILERQNDLEGAKRAFQQTLEICRALNDTAMVGTAIGNIGDVEADQGDFRSAKRHFQEALVIARQVGELRDCRKIRFTIRAFSYPEERSNSSTLGFGRGVGYSGLSSVRR